MDNETLQNAQLLMAGMQQLSNTVQAIQDNRISNKNIEIAEDQLNINKDIAEKNFNLQQDQFDYQMQLNNTLMQREDNAYQRQVADLKAAGLSPLMASGGASASPLTSAPAPLRDVSQINQALQNMYGAYNDYFSRRIQRQNFALQNRVQSAQSYANLAESKLRMQQAKIQKDILDLDYTYYKNHPERSLGLQQVIVNTIERILTGNTSGVDVPGVVEGVKVPISEDVKKVQDAMSYGAIDRSSKYAHNFDNENYDNNRSTINLIKQEAKEKFYKNQIKTAISGDNNYDDLLIKLFNTDDYLKKHISLENWKKADEKFILYYLKNGKFEGHKKYFD